MRMRFKEIAAAGAAMLLGSPALADITAHYVMPGGIGRLTIDATGKKGTSVTEDKVPATPPRPAITVEINDLGDTRLSRGNEQALLTLGGVTYLIESDLAGTFAVREDDWAAVQFEPLGAIAKDNQQPHDPTRYVLVSKGSETVAGRTGTLWALRSTGKAGDTFDAVLSADPDLAPVGRAIAAQFALSSRMMKLMLGSIPEFMAKTEEMLGKGAVIRLSRMLLLDGVSHDPIPASEFALPAVVLTKDQYAARAKSAR
ncbi:MAG TPA: hypothetical protein VGC56_05770 [Allosphingosinicella sp.]|jgi:hypothetical protein